MLTFDPGPHEYRCDGRPVPGVTSIIDPLGFDYAAHLSPEHLQFVRERGRAVHELIRLDVIGDLDEESLDAELLGCLSMWRAFLAATGFVVLLSERPVHSRRFGYAGTFDLFGYLPKRKRYALIDVKRGGITKLARLQTAAYLEALREELQATSLTINGNLTIANQQLAACSRFALAIRPDSWKLSDEYTSPEDFRVFLAALTIQQWRSKA